MNLAKDARARFESCKRAVVRLREVQLAIMNDCDDWRPPSVSSKHSMSDPTANRAVWRVDELGEQLAALKAEEVELTGEIGEALVVIRAVRDGLGGKYADVMEWRYIDLMKWEAIEHDYGIAKTTGHYLLNIAFDWVDSMGISRLLKGETEV
jgi:hypothetical protein